MLSYVSLLFFGTLRLDGYIFPYLLWLNVHEFEQTPGDSEEQESVAYYSPWGHKELDLM